MQQPKFSLETERFIHELCANAIWRAMQNGIYKPPANPPVKSGS